MSMSAEEVIARVVANPPPINLDAAGEYQNQVEIARSMEAVIVAMPLEELVDRASDQCGISYIGMSPDSTRELRELRSLFTVLRFAKKEIVKIQARRRR